MAQTNIFVVALDDFQRQELQATRYGKDPDVQLHSLLEVEDLVHVNDVPIDGLLDKARRQLDAFDGSVDAIIAHWDFPTSTLVPILCAERGLRAPSLRAVLQCEHKYWSRLTQQKVAPEATPPFVQFDAFDEDPLARIDLEFPFWVKPVKGFSSLLGFRIDNADDFARAMDEIRAGIGRLGEPFNRILERLDLPPQLADAGSKCIAEGYLEGIEVAHEGCVFEGEVSMHGTVDMVRHGETFHRYEHPSQLPAQVLERIDDLGKRLLGAFEFDNGVFNVEYFWNPKTDAIGIVEVNPRMSQSHSYLWSQVDGASNHEIAIDLALGRRPRRRNQEGPHRTAAKCFYRTYAPGIVRRVPTAEEVASAVAEHPGCHIQVVVEPGQDLGGLVDQDAYSFALAEVYVAGSSREDVLQRYERICQALPFEIEREGKLEEPLPPPEQTPEHARAPLPDG